MRRFLWNVLLLVATCRAFTPLIVVNNQHSSQVLSRKSSVALLAKKKKRAGKGFAKKEDNPAPVPVATEKPEASPSDSVQASSSSAVEQEAFLQSVQGGSTEIPVVEELSAEDRAKRLLRDKYGMKTLEEERLSQKQREQMEAQRKRFAEMKAKAEAGEDFDLIAMIPGPVIKGIYAFLQAGIAITGTAFILSGIGITLEAWSTVSGEPLPENIDTLIVDTIEPNFTPLLGVLLAFSVSLGALAAAQLGSKSATYKEE